MRGTLRDVDGWKIQSSDEHDQTSSDNYLVRIAQFLLDRLQVRQSDAVHVLAAATSSRLQLTSCPTGNVLDFCKL